jgi:hypothetical protein
VLCKVADLLVEIPEAGGMSPRCGEYLIGQDREADIVIDQSKYISDKWENLSLEDNIYLQSGFQFYRKLLEYNGLMLHSSALELDGRAYLFSGPCGVGKSTHTQLWQSTFGERVKVFNDDKPALRRLEDGWFAFGTPWCGKDGININMKVPLSGICFLKQGSENSIRRLDNREAVQKIIWQTTSKLSNAARMDRLLENVGRLVEEIPIYELCNRPEPEAALMSYHAMCPNA